MARKPGVHLPGGLYHVILRGNAQQEIFFDAQDREVLYALLEEGCARFGYRVHAFCLMTNHVHLALQPGDTPLSRGMQNLSFRYARHINRSQGRVGHLFQGRYKALLVEADSHLAGTGALYPSKPGACAHGRGCGGLPLQRTPRVSGAACLCVSDYRLGSVAVRREGGGGPAAVRTIRGRRDVRGPSRGVSSGARRSARDGNRSVCRAQPQRRRSNRAAATTARAGDQGRVRTPADKRAGSGACGTRSAGSAGAGYHRMGSAKRCSGDADGNRYTLRARRIDAEPPSGPDREAGGRSERPGAGTEESA